MQQERGFALAVSEGRITIVCWVGETEAWLVGEPFVNAAAAAAAHVQRITMQVSN